VISPLGKLHSASVPERTKEDGAEGIVNVAVRDVLQPA
jgi:hypothetical protein